MGSCEDKMSSIFVNPNVSLQEVVWHVVFGDGELKVGWLRWAVLLSLIVAAADEVGWSRTATRRHLWSEVLYHQFFNDSCG